jgi:hypothetical protein
MKEPEQEKGTDENSRKNATRSPLRTIQWRQANPKRHFCAEK